MTISILDPVKISNKYAIFSNQPDDLLFNKNLLNKPIFCAGVLREIGNAVYSYKIGDFLGYFSPNQELELEISSNLTVKIPSEDNHRLIFILPYALHAMNIMRRVGPKLGDTVLLIGENFFITLLEKLFSFSGAEVFVTSKKAYELIPSKVDIALISPGATENTNFLNGCKIERKYELTQFNIYDGGLDDPNYLKGVKYPYSYVRWQYKTNLYYFIDLIVKNRINLDFFKFTEKQFSNIDELSECIGSLKENSLVLFALQT
jgi:hypothetical protein